MHSELGIAVLTGLGGMVGWGLADLFAKKTIDEIGDIVTLVIAHIFGSLGIVVLALFACSAGHVFVIPNGIDTWAGLAFFGVLQGIVYLLVYIGFGKGQVAVLNPLFASFSGLVVLFSILFLGEVLNGRIVLALVVIFLGIFLLNVDFNALRERRLNLTRVAGFRQVGLATVLAAIWTLSWNSFVSGQDWLAYSMIMYLFMTIALLAYAWVRKVKLTVGKSWVWKYLVLIGLTEMGAYVAISWGYGATSFTSIVALLSGAFSLPTIILARVFLKERTTGLQLAASILIIIGIMIVSIV
jgi:drug/metabolite transporter (DMT)-like permease